MGITQSRRRFNLEIDRAKAGIKKSKAELDGQQSNLVKLQKQFDRTASLVKTGAAATAELDKITGDRDRALSQVNAAGGLGIAVHAIVVGLHGGCFIECRKRAR